VPVLEADVEVDRRDFTVAVALRVAAGERLAPFGPSGAGKTTALEAIAHELTEAQAFADRLAVLDAGRLLQDGADGMFRPWSAQVRA
jgi:ABC-type sulfate/molybdate transport systems ATPase subunit